MIENLKKNWLIHLLCLTLTLFYFWGLDRVPFHPDESTQIYMSQDLYDFFDDPLSLSFSPGAQIADKMRYRAIDAPLTRYLIALARSLTSSTGLPVDWDWTLTWTENMEAGALPSSSLLIASRSILVLLIPIILYLFYSSLRSILPKAPAVLALAFLALNPLVLLHGRRAMAEGVLLFGVILFIWSITRDRVNPAAVGVAIAVAFNAKQTGVFLLPVGIIAVCMGSDDKLHLKKMLARSLALISVFLLISIILNPYYWKSPLAALTASIEWRSSLLKLQLADHIQGKAPDIITSAYHLLNNLFIAPPAYFEITKYQGAVQKQIDVYQQILPHTWGRNLAAGSIQLVLVISGILISMRRYPAAPKTFKQRVFLLILLSACLAAGIPLALPIPWQRYILPLLPLTSIWIGFALLPISDSVERTIQAQKSSTKLS